MNKRKNKKNYEKNNVNTNINYTNVLNENITKYFYSNWIILSLLTLICAIVCVTLRYGVNNDLHNYHYYIGWALFHHRNFQDIAISLENTFLNPLLEIPLYFIVKYFNDYPLVLSAYNGIYWILLLFVFYKFNFFFFNVETIKGKIQILISMILGITGFATFVQIGTSSNEITTTFFIFWGIFLVYKELFITKTENIKTILFAGILMGISLGLKLTVFTFCIGIGFALICFYKYLRNPIKTIFYFALGGFLGFAISYGWWSYILYNNFGNPFFPYFNQIFKSPYYPEITLIYGNKFYPKTLFNTIFFPFLASFQGNQKVVAEAEFIDPRMFITYIIAIFFLIRTIIKKDLKQIITNNKGIVFLTILFIVSFILWFYVFTIIRYIVTLELLMAIFIVKFATYVLESLKSKLDLFFGCCVLFAFTFIFILYQIPYEGWSRNNNFKKIIYYNHVKLPDNSIVSGMSGNIGSAAAFIADDNPKTQFVNEAADFVLKECKFKYIIQDIMSQDKYKAYIIKLVSDYDEIDNRTNLKYTKMNSMRSYYSNFMYIVNKRLGRDNFYCKKIVDVAEFHKIFLCINRNDKYKVFPDLKEKWSSY